MREFKDKDGSSWVAYAINDAAIEAPGRRYLPDAFQQGWLVDTVTGKVASRSTAMQDVRAAAWVAGRLAVAMATREGFTVLRDSTGEVMVTATHGEHGNDAVFSADGLRVLTRSVDGGSRLWSLQTGRAITPFLWEGADPIVSVLDAEGRRVLRRGPPDSAEPENLLVDLPATALDALPATLARYRRTLIAPPPPEFFSV